jgi:hypothetical protein
VLIIIPSLLLICHPTRCIIALTKQHVIIPLVLC